ncbi:MAG: phage integrase SAM-like domain-containing protein [Flavobacteriales bacterium]|nr:phage integrase SAM-like domain-containing protein [Flavobacteriales bacterium]
MNIYLKKSSYTTKQGKSAILFDCFSTNYRKRINTNVYVPSENYNPESNQISRIDPKHVSLNIALKKLEQKRDLALINYTEEKWSKDELENFLKSGIELYSLDEYVINEFGDTKNMITSKDYINVVKVFKKHLNISSRIQFEELLDEQSILTFKINAIKNDLKQSSINSYVKKMKVIMNSAYRDGHISERFNVPESVIEEIPSNPTEIITYKEIEQGIAKITNIHQAQSIALFLMMLSCKGMYPADIMNYKKIEKNSPDEILISELFENGSDYIKFKKSKKSTKYKYVRITHITKKLVKILKTTFYITHYRKYSDILAPYNDPFHVFAIDIDSNNNIYKNLWNFYQKMIKYVLSYSFTSARDSFNMILEDQEMTNQTRNILTGDITQKELTQMHITKLSDARDKMRNIEDHINREFRVTDLVEILTNKLKLIGNNLDEITLENWETPKSFIASINKFK